MNVALTELDWPVAYPTMSVEGVANQMCPALSALSEEGRNKVEKWAIELLWNWSGRKYGTRQVAVRPCRVECRSKPPTFWGRSSNSLMPNSSGWMPALIGGEWFNLSCATCTGSRCTCSPNEVRSLELPGPADSIVSIWVEGDLLPDSSYVLRNDVIYRLDGKTLPLCNSEIGDPKQPDSGAWEIVYNQGYPVPIGGQVAAYLLACELAKSIIGDEDCALPARVQTVTRQGVTVSILDSFESLDEGRTGIWEIDAWLAAVTFKKSSPPQVFSPDVARGSHRGTFQGLGRGLTR